MQSAQFALHAKIEESHWWFVARRRIMRTLVHEVMPPDKATTIVDVGCGTGANIASLADEYNCVGIDTSTEAIGFAAERFPKVRYLSGWAPGDLGDVAGGAKLFLLMDVLEHVPDDFAMLSELLAAASEGTYFLMTVPAGMHLWSQHDESFGHYRRYTQERFAQVWAGLPVETLLLSYFNTRLYPLVRGVRAISRLRGRAGGQDGTDLALPSRPVNSALERIFAGESKRLVRLLKGQRSRGYPFGVSLVAILRRGPGEIALRSRPKNIKADLHNPAAATPQPAAAART